MVTRDEFDKAVSIWEEEAGPWSSTQAMMDVPSFAVIVDMGEVVVPWILANLQRKRSFLFLALESITGEDPISREHSGQVRLMVQDWIEWGYSHGYIQHQSHNT